MDQAKESQLGVALIFPGQGSQHVGMGERLCAVSPAARDVYRRADDFLQTPLTRLCFEGPEDELLSTINQQPATFVTSIAWLEALRERWAALGREFEPPIVSGHSLGEFTAAVAAGSLTFEDGLQLVQNRGRFMDEAGRQQPGGMAAVFGLGEDEVRSICADSGAAGYVGVAALNGEDQSVLSGALEPLLVAMKLAEDRGARKVVRLAITIASHSPLMQRASDQMNHLLQQVRISDPVLPMVGNVGARVLTSGLEVYTELRDQLTRSVRWGQVIQTMKAMGAELVLEVGPGHILTRLVRRIDNQLTALSLSDEREGLLSPSFGQTEATAR